MGCHFLLCCIGRRILYPRVIREALLLNLGTHSFLGFIPGCCSSYITLQPPAQTRFVCTFPYLSAPLSASFLGGIHSLLSFHIIYNKCVDILYNNPEIPRDTHLKSIGTSISVKQQDEKPGHPTMKNPDTPFRLEMRADSLSSNEEVSHLSTSTSRGVFP